MFGPIEIPAPEDGELTVVALGWSDAEIALALGVQPVGVYDWQSFGEANKGVGPWATELFGDVQPVILANIGDSLDYETIQSLNPDLILNTRSAGDEPEYNRLSTIAPTVYAPEGTAAFATRWDVQTQQVADALGLTEDGAAMVADVQAGITDAAAANPRVRRADRRHGHQVRRCLRRLHRRRRPLGPDRGARLRPEPAGPANSTPRASTCPSRPSRSPYSTPRSR